MEGYLFKNVQNGVPFIGVFESPPLALEYMDDFSGEGQFVLFQIQTGSDSPEGDITLTKVRPRVAS